MILKEIQRTAKQNGGKPLGMSRFETETGIKTSDWIGKFWARWGDAVTDAGFQPNSLIGKRCDNDILEHLALLARELGRFPVSNERKLKARSSAEFPSHTTFDRFGTRNQLVDRLKEYAIEVGYTDVVTLCENVPVQPLTKRRPSALDRVEEFTVGYIYLIRNGRYYKIGRSKSIRRRERELAIQLPEKTGTIHVIKTDDPSGIESYWHRRFENRRRNGEWFELTEDDIAAFKQRIFM